MPQLQKTLAGSAQVTGAGLHLGETTRVRLTPAPPNAGIAFVRTDLRNNLEIPATYNSVFSRQRRTTLKRGDAEVHTVEHLLSALGGLGITNLRVELDNTELPGLDGSSGDWVRLIKDAGIEEQDEPARTFVLDKPVTLTVSGGISLVALPHEDDGLSISYTLDYPSGFPRSQFFTAAITPDLYAREIAPARTFCLEAEAEALREAGLGKGANYENTLVIGPDGPIENSYRFPDEPVRHKVLDLVGDLTLLGFRLRAHVMGTRSGHQANVELVRRLGRALQEKELSGEVTYGSRLGIEDIMRILPHRYPFLLVDKVIEREGTHRAVGIKNVSVGDSFLQGHYPGKPIMPGVLQIEALAQLCGVLLMPKLHVEHSVAYLLSVDKCRFRRTVIPGDQLRLEVVTKRLKTRTAECRCTAFVGADVACEAQMRFMIVG